MSGDLISRSALIENYCQENCGERRCVDTMDRCVFICAVLEQPTAYNVDKVVEQLEDEKRIAFLTLANTGDKVKDAVYDEVMAYLKTAIEIVKAGGVE